MAGYAAITAGYRLVEGGEMKPEEYARMSEDRERALMMPDASARGDESESDSWRVHVYTSDHPRRPLFTMEKDDRNSAVRAATDFIVNGIMDLDGEFIPKHRIYKVWIQEPRVEWQVQEG